MAARLAAVSDDLDSRFEGAVGVAVAAGLDGLAVRHVDGTNVRDLPVERVREIRRAADAGGITIAAVSSPVGRDVPLGSADDDAALERMLVFADILGTPLIRVFAAWLPGRDPVPQWWERPHEPHRLERTAERLGRYAGLAQRAGVTLMLELEGASHVGQVSEARAVLDAVDSPALALCWDVCNGWWSGELPWEEAWPVARTLPIVDVQAKDVAADPADPRRPTYAQVRLGNGDIPYERIVGALLTDGYDGWFTAERVYHPRRPESEQELLADVLADVAALRGLVGR